MLPALIFTAYFLAMLGLGVFIWSTGRHRDPGDGEDDQDRAEVRQAV